MKFGGVQYDAIGTTLVQKLAAPEELLLDGHVPDGGVVDTPVHPLKLLKQSVHPVRVGIPSREYTLGEGQVAVPAPGRDKACELPVLFSNLQGVVAMPAVKCTLQHTFRYGDGQ